MALSCTKDPDFIDDDSPITFRAGRSYDEMACIVDNKSGIKCFESIGKTCRKEKGCTPVLALGAEQYFTSQELAAWPNINLDDNIAFKYHMWEIGWFIHPDEDH